jgi:hypothetical protein
MNKVKQFVFFPIATFAIAGLLISCSSPNGLVSKPNEETGKVKVFQLSGLSVNPTEVAARDEVVITAEITNVASVDDTYNAELKINNVVEAFEEVLVPAGKTQALTFVIFKDTPGTYKVNLGQLTGQFAVTKSIAAVTGNQTPAVPAQASASCCGVGNQSTAAAQTGAGCCGTGAQSSPAAQSRRTYGCSCGR